ncbi:hypothetical protein ABZX90_39795 [Streptomyces sp. NPDC002935]|uniref:hypothetical protein n=1 Tax=Streptomyces sp. NPDC002935 TaxID=3154545 RepID=UPI0033A1978E
MSSPNAVTTSTSCHWCKPENFDANVTIAGELTKFAESKGYGQASRFPTLSVKDRRF